MRGIRRLVVLALCAVTATLAACGGDSATGPSASIAGAYTLRTVNGGGLPFTLAQVGADKLELLNETVVLSEGGTFTQQGSFRITEAGVVSTEFYADAGAYTRSGTAVTFVFNSDGSSGTGTVASGTITVAFEGFSLVYRK